MTLALLFLVEDSKGLFQTEERPLSKCCSLNNKKFHTNVNVTSAPIKKIPNDGHPKTLRIVILYTIVRKSFTEFSKSD